MRAKFKVSFQSGNRLGAHHSSGDTSDDFEGCSYYNLHSLCKVNADVVPMILMASETQGHCAAMLSITKQVQDCLPSLKSMQMRLGKLICPTYESPIVVLFWAVVVSL